MMPAGIKSVKSLSYGKMFAYHAGVLACNQQAMSDDQHHYSSCNIKDLPPVYEPAALVGQARIRLPASV
jgi:hypothetical protein